MTDKLICPFCQQELLLSSYRDGDEDNEVWNCLHCQIGGKRKLWQELIRTRKALELAKDALKEQQRWFGVIRVSLISHLNNEYGTAFKSYDADPTVVNVKKANNILNTALDQIKALEQKDVK